MDFQSRTRSMLGEKAVERLNGSHVIVFGLGGVGGHAAETLCRAGIGSLTLVDAECFEPSNCNRQIFATLSTIGQKKAEAAKERLLGINPNCDITSLTFFFGKDPLPDGIFDGVDYIIDAIDTVSAKIALIEFAKEKEIPIISCMGTGNKLDPTAFLVSDLEKTSVCPLARVMRAECRKRGLKNIKVVYSKEEPISAVPEKVCGRHAPGSISFVPGVAGMILAGEAIKDLAGLC